MTSSWGSRRYYPFAFTEQGVAMLSSVLNSDLEAMEKKYDAQFKIVFDAIRQLMTPTEKAKRQIGFQIKEPKSQYKFKIEKTM